ncbi:MAG: sigma-70 family RNA polymerase sigma factor [Acidobacteriota bacterium]
MTDPASRSRATQILSEVEAGDPQRADELMPLVYDELRSLAARYLRRESPGHTLQPTALVHEAYLRLIDQNRVEWQGRTHFFAVGARIMHRLLIDHGRNRKRAKRGGGWMRVTLSPDVASLIGGEVDLLVVHEMITRLETLDPRQAKLVKLRFYGGLSMAEIAEVLGVSKRTAEGDWTHAKAWMARHLATVAAGRQEAKAPPSSDS